MQKQEELNKVWKFINTVYYSTFLIKKPSWLQYYCLCQNENIAYSTLGNRITCDRRIYIVHPEYTLKYHKEHYEDFEVPNEQDINELYLIWKKWYEMSSNGFKWGKRIL
jgi:hypothetical protein